MRVTLSGEVISWRGPAPFVFLVLPEDFSAALKGAGIQLSYGWGCIGVTATLGESTWKTSLMPKQGRYLLPIKAVIQKAEGVQVGNGYEVELEL